MHGSVSPVKEVFQQYLNYVFIQTFWSDMQDIVNSKLPETPPL